MWTFNKSSVDQAVSILPGVTMNNTGGARNERDVLVRGFDRLRVPLYMDGVRIYLPYDNRLDFNRFLTPDLSEIQVEKGYVSVLNGPGGEGGAINLVSRKPTKEIELEGRAGAVFDGDLGSMGQWNAYAYAGTRQKGYYAQLSGTIVDQNHFDLSNDFTPASPATTLGYLKNFPYEDGGDREHSGFEDWRVNTKVGVTPNKTDEYSINYTNQQAEKEAPLSVDRQIVQGYFLGNNCRYWDWPQWDISTLSWLSKTQIGDKSYVKTNAYWNTFDNIVDFFRPPPTTRGCRRAPIGITPSAASSRWAPTSFR
jgi:iron complex outermembrane recepter protein